MGQHHAHDHHDHGHDHGQDHDHAHGHGHHHGPGHVHAPASFGRAFAIGIALNTGFVLIEGGYGFLTDSVALLADAGHNLSDVLGLVVAWAAATLGQRRPTARFTYGLRSSSILAALFNAVFLLVAVGAIALEAVQRFSAPAPVPGLTVTIVALVGIAVNGITAWLFASGRKGDLNIRGAYLHMLADAAVSAGVVVAGLVILWTGWTWVDPLTSLVIVAVIVAGTWGLLRDSVVLSLDAVPPGLDPADVRRCLAERPGVSEVHDLHVWPMSTTETALTAHLVMPAGHPGNAFLNDCAATLRRRFGIAHVTLQVELAGGPACALAPDHVV
ncbi:cation diffusion facilitator family transporter [Methylobacterium indicum]|uniref:Cobalt transporter n=1 Tax=Methylobacterium indicum TaxID=1775910 RepID=A0A8H8WTE6_9HYPH|nr:cation diffusion facilitator family transporter [Methylobacterium indicum]BCM83992.1 cobalt transporter [Methylobacterium indicum]